MSYFDLLEKLRTPNLKGGFDAFGFLSQLASLVTLAEDDEQAQQARELCVRILDQKNLFAGYEPVVQDLLRAVGLFPYLDRQTIDVSTQLAMEAHRPRAMPEKIIFTTKQAEVYRELMAGRNVVLSAPTSFGKSLIIDAIVVSERHKNIVVVVPTLALVDETRRRLSKFSDRYKIITHLSQLPAERNIYVQTQERVVENPYIDEVDFFVIDEFYKLQIDPRHDDDSRGVLLNQAFYQLVKKAKQFYMLGPNIHDLPKGFGKNFRCTFIRTDFSTVAADTYKVPEGDSDEDRIKNLIPMLHGPTLVFSGSVKKVRSIARGISECRREHRCSSVLRNAIDWMAENFHPEWGVVEALRCGVGVHHGRLPRAIAQLLVKLFNDGHLDYLVCTSTLIEGVNTAARNVVIADNTINRKKYDFFTFNNIRGRSGRMWQHYVGRIYLFHAPPQPELELVDVPSFTQGSDAPNSLLVQLDKEDLSPLSVERMNPIWNQRYLSIETIKANAGIKPEGQIALARYIEEHIDEMRSFLGWHRVPTYDQLYTSLKLAWEHFGTSSAKGVASASQLTYKLSNYARNPRFKSQIALAVRGKTGEDADEAMEDLLDFARQWVSFRTPRMLYALERIQAEVFKRNGVRPGDYSFYCSRLESLFLNPVVIALDEYGVPMQLSERVVSSLGNPDSLDGTLQLLKTKKSSNFGTLSQFEQTLLKPLCKDAPKAE